MPYGPYIVEYKVQYPDEDCFMILSPAVYDMPNEVCVMITLQGDITIGEYYFVQDVMESAVETNPDLLFSVYYAGSDMYFVRALGNTSDTEDCMWYLYYKAPDEGYPLLQTTSVSKFIAEPNSTVVMSYKFPTIHQVHYKLEFPISPPENCSISASPRPGPLTLNLTFTPPANMYSVLRIMEVAADMDPSYKFLVTYWGKIIGYTIDAINGTANNPLCVWEPLYLPTRRARNEADGKDLSFEVAANSTVIMNFKVLPLPPASPEPSSSSVPPVQSSTPVVMSPSPDPTSPGPEPSTSTRPPVPTSTRIPTMTPTNAATTTVADNVILLLSIVACLVILLAL